MGVNAGSKEHHNDIIGESTNSSNQQYVTIDDGNPDDSNADIISETLAVDEDIWSNNRSGNETNNNNWTKGDLDIYIKKKPSVKHRFENCGSWKWQSFALFQRFGFEWVVG